MNNEMITALITFALVSSITPGPNNIMLMSSGTNFGFRKTIPHMLGVSIGFAIMVFLVGVGLMEIFTLFPVVKTTLKIISVIYLMYLSYKIAFTTSSIESDKKRATPLTFIQAVLFQWVNPKAWTMALTAITLYASSSSLFSVLKVSLVYGVVNLPAVSTWVLLGKQIRKLLKSQIRLRIFNIIMALLLLSSLVFLV